MPPEAIAAEMAEYNAFTAHLRERGAMKAGEALDSIATATTVRVVDGRTITTDGPFAETKETLGGFYLVEAADLDEAIAYAAMIPGARNGCIEVRPIWDYTIAGGERPGRRRRPGTDGPGRSRPSLTGSDAAHEIVDRLFREEQGRAVATLIRVTGDFDLAEEAVQDAFISALETWPSRGVPDNPGAWITTTARNRAIDRLRRRKRLVEKTETLAREAAIESELRGHRSGPSEDAMHIADDRLRLIFTCCHPALAMDARVALTLRTLGGLTTPEIARAFLVPEPTLAQRLVRAKRKIRDAGHPLSRPAGGAPARAARRRPARRSTSSSTRAMPRRRATRSSGASCAPRRSGWHGSSSRCSPTSRRRAGCSRSCSCTTPGATRASGRDGELVLLDDQDRSRWDAERIAEGRALVERALVERRPGPYQLQAAIAALHDEAATPADTDWAADRRAVRRARSG